MVIPPSPEGEWSHWCRFPSNHVPVEFLLTSFFCLMITPMLDWTNFPYRTSNVICFHSIQRSHLLLLSWTARRPPSCVPGKWCSSLLARISYESNSACRTPATRGKTPPGRRLGLFDSKTFPTSLLPQARGMILIQQRLLCNLCPKHWNVLIQVQSVCPMYCTILMPCFISS